MGREDQGHLTAVAVHVVGIHKPKSGESMSLDVHGVIVDDSVYDVTVTVTRRGVAPATTKEVESGQEKDSAIQGQEA